MAKWIVAAGSGREGRGLFKWPLDGGVPIRIIAGPFLDPVQRDGERASFLPNGSGLVYMLGTTTAGQDFWLLDLDSMRSRRLTHFSNPAAMRTFDITRRQAHRLRPLPRKLRHTAHRSGADVRLGEGLARVAVHFGDKSVPEPGDLQ